MVTLSVPRWCTVFRTGIGRLGRLHQSWSIFALLLAVLCVDGAAAQAPKIDTTTIGPQVGQKVPDFLGTDQRGMTHTLASSLGASGAMLVFFRSADW
jgi:hypothetical protein